MLFCYTALHCTYHIHTHAHRNLDCMVCYTAVLLHEYMYETTIYTGKHTPQAVSQNSSGPYQADHHYNAVLDLHFVQK